MQPERHSTLRRRTEPAVPDLSCRADPALVPEQMDGPCSYEDFRACVRDIAAVTRLTLAYGPIRRFVRQVLLQNRGIQPLHVVDVGCGGGDVIRHLASWARGRRHPLRFTGIDINPYATRAAREFTDASRAVSVPGQVQWLTGDVFTHPQTQAPDIVISSLVTHHMQDAEIVLFLRWMEDHATLGWFISDLVRSARSYRLFGYLSRAARWHPFVQHDGLVSLQRSFRQKDWKRLLLQAGIAPEQVVIRTGGLGRLCLTRLR